MQVSSSLRLATLVQALTCAGAAEVVFVPKFSKYPDYSGDLEVVGSVTIVGTPGNATANMSAAQTLTWSLTGLDTACTAGAGDNVTNGCGIHIHMGTSCETAAGVGGHYFDKSAVDQDPWLPTVYVSSSDGTSNENTGVQVVTGLPITDIMGKVVVIHQLATGDRIACGKIGTMTGSGPRVYAASFAPYPGYDGDLKVEGGMTVVSHSGNASSANQSLTWSLSGLDTRCTPNAADGTLNGCGVHIHVGTSCDSAGGHYFSSALDVDPWEPIVYVTGSVTSTLRGSGGNSGTSDQNVGVEVVTGLSAGDITGRVMVVHDVTGARVACCVLGLETGAGVAAHVPSFVPYPDYTGSLKVTGSVGIVGSSGTDSSAKQTLAWDLAGLDTACTAGAADSIKNGCGIHVHTGTSCDQASAVGGHYYSEALAEDPWLPVVYEAAADGKSKQGTGVPVVTGLSSADIIGRVMVVHRLADGARIACGVIVSGYGKRNASDSSVTSSAIQLRSVLPYLLMSFAWQYRA